jgi:uncharacterized membrane protein YhaH (DUF805 family)
MREQLRNFFNFSNFFSFSGRATGFQVVVGHFTWLVVFIAQFLLMGFFAVLFLGISFIASGLIAATHLTWCMFCDQITHALPLFAGGFFLVFGVLFGLFLLLEIFLFALSTISFLVRRFHDLNCSGWWCVVFLFFELFVPFLYLVLVVFPSTKGANRFGPEVGNANVLETI